MITEKTLFILGAGAHVPYGFPDAKGLKEKIVTESTNLRLDLYNKTRLGSDNERQFIRTAGQKFSDEFRASGIYSIDLFLSLRPEFKIQGKWAIINSILEVERQHKKSGKYNLDDWFLYLYNNLISGIYSDGSKDKFFENKIGFLTFNYDRMIEHYFESSLTATFDLAEEKLFEYFNLLSIKHVHGSIAPLKSEIDKKIGSNPVLNNVEYGQEIQLHQIDKLKDNIKIINEERNTDATWSDIISSYNRIFFLGFSYADENLGVLNLPGCLRKGQQIFGTAFRNSENEIKKIRQKFYKTSWMNNAQKDLIIRPVDNLTLLRDHL